MTFTKAQREAVETRGTVPMTIDGIDCVVLRADLYNRERRIFEYNDGEIAPEESYPAIVRAWDADGSPHDAEDYSE